MGETLKDRMKLIVDTCIEEGVRSPAQIQYVIATALWESNFTLQPKREAYWVRNWDRYIKNNPVTRRYYPYYGRGLVQLTWEKNYQKFSEILGVDLVTNPDLALGKMVSVRILVVGMRDGIFTGRALDDYINEDKVNFVEARYIVNGKDKRKEIATLTSGVDINRLTYVKNY